MGCLEFVMNENWQSSKNYINEKLLNSDESITLTRSVEINYKSISIPPAEQDHIKIQALSFFCDSLLVYADTQQDEFILGLNNHTYLEFKRKHSGGVEKTNQFQLIGVRSVDSLDQHQVILLQGVLASPQVDFLSLK